MHNFFLSHYNGDRQIADIIATILKRVTLNQIQPWFSSDESGSGGLRPGMIWFNSILEKIEKSKAIVVILTPNSIQRPWIYFESGIAQSLEACEVIPICIGIDRNEVYPPLGLYQCYQLNSYRALKEFLSKLLNKIDIPFDEEAFKPHLEEALSKLLEIKFTTIEKDDPKTLEMLDNLKSHIDKRFIEIWEKPNISLSNLNLTDATVDIESVNKIENNTTYTIQIEINIDSFKSKHFIEIRYEDTFKTISTELYFIMKDYIEAFRYLQSWIIREKKSGKLFVIREIADLIPARYLFKPELIYEVIKLPKPYNPKDSRDRVIFGKKL